MKTVVAVFLSLGLLLLVAGQEDCQNGSARKQDGGECVCLKGSTGRLCEVRTVDICDMEAETGRCRALLQSFFYNNTNGSCMQFIYGGCGGNANNFITLEDCDAEVNALCRRTTDAFCNLPPETGRCKALIPRFHHDPADGACKQFNYGGCGGNANNFKTQGECEVQAKDVCGPKPNAFCDQPAKTGRCRASMPRFHYDAASQTCKSFIYGGCDANDNNFETQEECDRRAATYCTDMFCALPKDPGMCRAYLPRFYFDSVEGTCKEFIYGGCGGNANNFKSEAECLEAMPKCTQEPQIFQIADSGSMATGLTAVLASTVMNLVVRML